jgi:Ca-activated chloride channel family protein
VTGAWSTTLALQSPQHSAGIAALWARARIGWLIEEERRRGDAAEARTAIVETALEHHLVSKYTSLVAVDKTPVRPAGDDLSSEQVPNLMPYGQNTNAIFGFPATATNGPMLRMIGGAYLLAALLIFALYFPGTRSNRVVAE